MVQVLEAPLWGGRASVVLLLPFHVENLAKLEKLLTLELLSKWLEKASVTSVAISLPKANITSTLSLQVSSAKFVLVQWHKKILACPLNSAHIAFHCHISLKQVMLMQYGIMRSFCVL